MFYSLLCLKLFIDVWLQLYEKSIKVITLYPQKRKKLKNGNQDIFKDQSLRRGHKGKLLSPNWRVSWFRESQLIAANLEQKPGQPVAGRRRDIAEWLVYISCVVRNSWGREPICGNPHSFSSVLPLGGPLDSCSENQRKSHASAEGGEKCFLKWIGHSLKQRTALKGNCFIRGI